MPDLLWDEVRSLFDPRLMGALPEVSVVGASAEDWQAVFDLVRSRGWAWEYRVGDVVTALPTAVEALGRPADAELAELRVCWRSSGCTHRVRSTLTSTCGSCRASAVWTFCAAIFFALLPRGSGRRFC